MKKFLLLSIILFIFFIGCKKTDQKNEQPKNEEIVTQGIISGNLILPNGSSINSNSLSIQSPIASAAINNGKFDIKTFTSDFTTQLIFNSKQEVLMLGYHYPGQTDFNISSTSTALALVMNARSIFFLSPTGKKQMLAKVLADKNFAGLVQTVESSILSNGKLFDTTNVVLMQHLKDVFESASQKPIEIQGKIPVIITVVGKELNFQNDANAHSSVIGIYKDGKRDKKIIVEGLQFSPTSISETMNGYGGISADPVVYTYPLKEEGPYQLKIRTGRPGSNDGSIEYSEAFYENLGLFSYNLLSTLLPTINASGCNKATLITNIINVLSTVPDIINSTNTYATIHTATSTALQSVDNIVGNCNTIINKMYFSTIAKAFNFIDNTFSIAGNFANLSSLSVTWTTSNPATDICYNLLGSTVGPCPLQYKLGFRDATPVPIAEISFDKGGGVFFILLNEDGTAATGIDYNKISVDANTNTKVSVDVTPSANSFILSLNTNQKTSQKTSFDILYQSKKVQTINALVNDSTEYYESLVPGNWSSIVDYDFTNNGSFSFYQEDKFILYADGTGKRTMSRTYTGGITDWTSPGLQNSSRAQMIWKITNLGSGGYHMTVGDKQNGFDPNPMGRITPALLFNYGVSSFKMTTRKE